MNLQILAQRYHRYREWAQRSGYTPMDWHEYKASRLANRR